MFLSPSSQLLSALESKPGSGRWPPSRCPTYPRITVSSGGFKENDPNFPLYSRPDLSSQPRMSIPGHLTGNFLVFKERTHPP